MSGRALFVLASLAAAAPATAEMELRVSPAVRSGAGVASDLFLGAGVGPGAELVMAPALTLDASLHARVKVHAEYDMSYAFTQRNQGSAWDHFGAIALRARPWGRLWVEGIMRAGLQRFDEIGMPDDSVVGRRLTSYQFVAPQPQLRYSADSFDIAGGYVYVVARSVDAGGQFEPALETAHRGLARISLAPTRRLGGGVAYRFTRNWADGRDDLKYWSNEFALVGTAALWDGAWLRIEASAQHSRFVTNRVDWLLRGGATLLQRVHDGVSLEFAYGYAHNLSSDEGAVARRHFGYAGVRAEMEPWRF